MKTKDAIRGYAALSTEVRVSILKLLAKAGTEGLAAGEIARKLNMPHNSLSQQMSVLVAAGLVYQKRESRNVFYRIDFGGIRSLIRFLAVDCIGGRKIGVTIDA